jgi:5-methylcytosine-specific restriction endonuclease McrA
MPFNSLERRRGLKPVSDKRAALEGELKAWRTAVLKRDRYNCQARAGLGTPCDGRKEAHHVTPRSRAPQLLLDVANGLTVCAFHHDVIDRNPAEAKALGLLK